MLEKTTSKNAGAPWYLLQIKPNGYARAELNLARQSVETFHPKQKIASKKGEIRLAPLFPGYLFASFDMRRISFGTVNSTFGVNRLVTLGYSLERGLPAALVDGLLERCDENGLLCPPETLRSGETIRILTGPFADYIATVETLTIAERVRVLFELMGRTVRAEVAVSEVERAVCAS